MSKWITREETYSNYDIYETKPFWVSRWLRWGGTPLFRVDSKLLESLRPDLKLKGGLNKKKQKEIKKLSKPWKENNEHRRGKFR